MGHGVSAGVGSVPGRALKIRTLGAAGGTSQEALHEGEEEHDTISGTPDTEKMDGHEPWLLC